MRFPRPTLKAILFTALLVFAPITAQAQTDAKAGSPGQVSQDHPLSKLLQIATEREQQIREKVRDYTCRIVKRERIRGKLQEDRFIDAKIRLAQDTKPMAVYMKFLGPKDIAGRTVVYEDGKNDGKMVVRRGGNRFEYVVTNVETDSDAARRESLMDIRHMGVTHMVSEITKHLHEDMQGDPTGENTVVKVFENAKISGRVCKHVRITHPKRQDNLKFYVVNIYADNELHLPVRVDAYDWPQSEGKEPELLGEFTYTNVKINVGLQDGEFHPDRLRTASRDR